MPEGHEIPVFEQEAKRGPGRPRKVEAVEAPLPVVEVAAVEEPPVKAGPRKVKIVIHVSEDGRDVEMIDIPQPGTMAARWLHLPRNQEIVVSEEVLPILDGLSRIVDERYLLDDRGKPTSETETKRYKTCPYTVVGFVDD